MVATLTAINAMRVFGFLSPAAKSSHQTGSLFVGDQWLGLLQHPKAHRAVDPLVGDASAVPSSHAADVILAEALVAQMRLL